VVAGADAASLSDGTGTGGISGLDAADWGAALLVSGAFLGSAGVAVAGVGAGTTGFAGAAGSSGVIESVAAGDGVGAALS